MRARTPGDPLRRDATRGYPLGVPTLTRAVAVALGCAAAVLALPPTSATATTAAVGGSVTGGSTVSGTDTVGGPALASPGIVVHRSAGSTPLPAVQADSWLVADLTTGEVLAAKGAHHRALPASMLKTLTAVTLMPALDPTMVVTATYDEARADGGHVGIVPGATYTVWDLWHGLLLPSANDAAAALADANGGMARTVAQMQAKATYLHADDTTVRNNSGLDNPSQLSSAYDMALFARAAMQIPDFRTVTATVSYDFPGLPAKPGATRKTYKIYSQNRLLLHGYRGTVGGKTGFTSLAHRTFWGAASRGGHTLLVTLFQIKDPTEKAARALLDWGFANLGKVAPVGTLVEPGDVASPSPTPSPAVVGTPASSTTAAGTSPTGSSLQVPWLPLGAGVALVVGVALWWRRRTRAASWESLPDDGGGAAASVLATSVLPAARHDSPAAVRTGSVVVTGPLSAPGTPPAGDPVTDGASEVDPLDDTGPVPVVAVPHGDAPNAAADRATTVVADAVESQPDIGADAVDSGATRPPAPAPDPTGGTTASHVRVIRPPSRPS